MKRNVRWICLGVALAAGVVSRGSAQNGRPTSPTPAQLRGMIIQDSLTPAKMELRDVVAKLRDTLISVQALHSSIMRNLASGGAAVVISNGRELGKRCRVGEATADLTVKRISAMYTNEPKGDQALNGYRAGLNGLIDELRTCQRDDSATMAAKAPDPRRIEQVATAARDAVARYDVVRDALMKLLSIDLPISGRMRPQAK